ncbi:trace amine-associated receptor 1-like [Salarias fasciatus]|uniref:trace amine-associated receptor 1-like n=1 Tax=Salarias fasciatus TaxID=181472 RepID=UPI001176D590|nr:trace amine-associated receptor 1-like [Salarias fasciatus]
MAGGDPVNHSHTGDTHLCYEIDIFSSTFKRSPSTICVLLYILFSSLSAVTVCGNLLIIISIIYFQQLHTPTNFLILSLAVTDLLVGFVVFPLNMEFSPTSCLFNPNVFCKVGDIVDVTLSTASILHLCCISIDRYYAVCQPLTYRTKINVHVVVIMIVVAWCISILVAVSFNVSKMNYEKCSENCFIGFLLTAGLGTFSFYYLPVIIMLCIYMKILLVARKQARSIQNTNCHSKKKGLTVRNVEGKATRTLAIVMGVFLICWAPVSLSFALQLLGIPSISAEVFETVIWLALFNSMLNPFIYAFFYSWFRSAFRLILSGKIFQGDFSHSKLV